MWECIKVEQKNTSSQFQGHLWTSLTSSINLFKLFHKCKWSKWPKTVGKSYLQIQLMMQWIVTFKKRCQKGGQIPVLGKPTHMDYLEKSKWTQIQHNAQLTSKWIVHMNDCPTRRSLNVDLDVHPAQMNNGAYMLSCLVARVATLPTHTHPSTLQRPSSRIISYKVQNTHMMSMTTNYFFKTSHKMQSWKNLEKHA